MREIGFETASALLRFFGFDPLQESAIVAQHMNLQLINKLFSQASVDYYQMTTANFRKVIASVKSAKNKENISVVVTDIPNLSLLGLSVEDFSENTLFLTLEQFTDALVGNSANASLVEEAIRETSRKESFFNDSSLTKSQLDLLIHISNGHTNVEISRLMFLTEKGVESAIKRLALKLGCNGAYQKQQNLRILLGRRYAELLGVLS
ncbi:Transcription regulator LuxR, C-terminal [Candidatus Nanopelagicaceae bacterium]